MVHAYAQGAANVSSFDQLAAFGHSNAADGSSGESLGANDADAAAMAMRIGSSLAEMELGAWGSSSRDRYSDLFFEQAEAQTRHIERVTKRDVERAMRASWYQISSRWK